MNSSALFIPDVHQVHPDWYKEWGKAIGSPELAEEMFNNERLRNRVHEQIINSGELELDARFSDVELACLQACAQDRKRLEKISGLVIYGKILRENVNKADFDPMAKMIALDDLRTAVGLRDYHIEDIGYSVDMSRLDELVQRTGASCVTLWKNNLYPQMRLRVDLLDKPDTEDANGNAVVSEEQAAAIVCAVAHTVWSDTLRLAA